MSICVQGQLFLLINTFHFCVIFLKLLPWTDELIKEVQVGCCFSFVVLPSCEIHDSSVHFLCTPVFEVMCRPVINEIMSKQ